MTDEREVYHVSCEAKGRRLYSGYDPATAESLADWWENRYGWRPVVRVVYKDELFPE